MIDIHKDYIDKLNAETEGGRFIKTVILTEETAPLLQRFYADNPEPITWNGNTYQPLGMSWGNIKTSESMPVEGSSISVSNLGNSTWRYVKNIDISGQPIRVELLHYDFLDGTITTQPAWQRIFKILRYRADRGVLIFDVGRDLGHNRLPRHVILKDEYRGLSSDVPRIF